jgi:Fe-S-cluster containining protein
MLSEDLIQQWRQAVSEKSLPHTDHFKALPKANAEQLDEEVSSLHEHFSACIDCLSCANCCKTTVTVFSPEDIGRASKYLGMSRKVFIKKYLIEDMGEFTTINTPCPFLLPDNKCRIYEARPYACQSFPHTGRPHFLKRLNAHKNNLKVCPITFHVVSGIKS